MRRRADKIPLLLIGLKSGLGLGKSQYGLYCTTEKEKGLIYKAPVGSIG
jgi:hypothetical protein